VAAVIRFTGREPGKTGMLLSKGCVRSIISTIAMMNADLSNKISAKTAIIIRVYLLKNKNMSFDL
jgi:hypothetical protein